MISPFRRMYLRPGNLWNEFKVKELTSDVVDGYPVNSYTKKGNVSGVLAEADDYASERMKHRWDQDQHSLTHTLIVRGKANLKKGDFITMIKEDRNFIVLTTDDVGGLGATGIVYLEERNDVK